MVSRKILQTEQNKTLRGNVQEYGQTRNLFKKIIQMFSVSKRRLMVAWQGFEYMKYNLTYIHKFSESLF